MQKLLLLGLGILVAVSACSSSSSGTTSSGAACSDAPEGTRALATDAITAEKCTFPPTVGSVSARLRSTGGTTYLYLSVQEKPNVGAPEMRRYVLREGEACAFERDTTFNASQAINFAADDLGTLYSGESASIVRVRGEERTTCTSSLQGGFFVSQERFDVARDGSFGIVNVGNSRSIGKLTTSADACSLGLVELSQPLLQPDVLAIDAKKRFHVAALAVGEDDLSPRIAVVDADGVVACAYHSTRKSSERKHEAIVPCGEGMCIDGGDEMVKVTADGVFVRAARVSSPLERPRLVGASEAPYPLLVGNVGKSLEVGVFAIRGL